MMAMALCFVSLCTISPIDESEAPSTESVRMAVQKALPLITKSMADYQESRDCFSCHHQAVPVLAVSTAKERGFVVADDVISGSVDYAESDLRGALEIYQKGTGQPGGVTRAGYALLTMELGGKPRDKVTEAVARFLLKRDEVRVFWEASSKRPPSEASEFTATYLALRALAAYGTDQDREQIADRVAKARGWLESATPKDTEDRVFRLLGLKQASASAESIRAATEALIATRREDGGWAQLDDAKSDAYATGSSLVALHLAGGIATDRPEYRSGLAFLISTQRKDGTWFVASRSRPFQPYFESGFPYGKDQFISMAATSWSVTALALACPKP